MQRPGGPIAGENGDQPLPRWIQYLIEQFDAFAANRPDNQRLPVILLKRDVDPAATPQVIDAAAARMIVGYQDRLSETDHRRSTALVPHAFVDDAEFTPRERVADEEPEAEAEPHIALVDRIAGQLEFSMPPGSGGLRLPQFHTCRAVLRTSVGTGSLDTKRRRLRDRLYQELMERRPWLGILAKLADATGKNALTGFALSVFELLVVGLPRWVYGVWLSRGRGLRWVGRQMRPPGRDFLGAALAITAEGVARDNHALVQRLLLMALLRDLRKAARPSRLWVHRVRRPWSFVLLLGAVGETETPTRQFLDTYADIVRSEPPAPLMVLGALTGAVPSYAVTITPDSTRPTGIADQVHDLYTGRSEDLAAEGVYVVPLSRKDDDGAARRWVGINPKIPARANGPRDYVPLVLFLLVPALAAAGLAFAVLPPSACHRVDTGEIVGVTDGRECSLAAPGRDQELRALEKVVAEQNEKVDLSAPYRSVVFFAPLSTQPGDSTPTTVQGLRGAITAQAQVNGREVQNKMPIRLLIANSGKYFAYGSRTPHGPDVAQEIIDRAEEDHIAAVIGIMQSRPVSLQAVKELDDAQIPVIGNSVTGSRMVDEGSPSHYFQVSASNGRIAQLMAEFSQNSEQIGALTETAGGASGGRDAVVVYDPGDEYFSVDLMAKFKQRYSGGNVELVAYYETKDGQDTRNVARDICTRIQRSRGFVVYAGRSGSMPDLFNALQQTAECQKKNGKQIAVLAESTAPTFIQDPAQLKDYPFLKLYYVVFNNSSGKENTQDRYAGFTDEFAKLFKESAPESNAAGAYDALTVTSDVINSVYAQYPDANFKPNEVYARLANPGVSKHLGASGVITLNSGHKHPPNKAVYILESLPNGNVTTLMACGLLPDQEDPTHWGTGTRFPCPKEQ